MIKFAKTKKIGKQEYSKSAFDVPGKTSTQLWDYLNKISNDVDGVSKEDLLKGLEALDAELLTNFEKSLDPQVVAISRPRIDWLNSLKD